MNIFAIMWQKRQMDGFLPLLPSCGKSGKRMNIGFFAIFCHFYHHVAKVAKDEFIGFLPLLPSCGKSGKRMNYRIFAIMWQKWLKMNYYYFCHFCHHVAKVAKG